MNALRRYHVLSLMLCIIFIENVTAAKPKTTDQRQQSSELRRDFFRVQNYDSLYDALGSADEKIAANARFDVAVIVYTVSTADGQPIKANTKFRGKGKDGPGCTPGRIKTNEVAVQPVAILQHQVTKPVELRISAPGYQEVVRRVILKVDDIVIWDDIILTPITYETAAIIVGRLTLENDDPEGIAIYVDNEAVTFTDAKGYFLTDMVRSGTVEVSAYIRGYPRLNKKITLHPGEETTVELNGFRHRQARIRWAYQPNEIRVFDKNIRTGEALITAVRNSRISFTKGFQEVLQRSDFHIYQEDDKLMIQNFDKPRRGIPPGIIKFENKSLKDIIEAPESGYAQSKIEIQPGDVYIFRCYDGKNYALMEVLDVEFRK